MGKILLKGNEAVAEAAVRCGCRYYFGYPITPQNEIPEYMSWRLPEVGGVFVQAESELASINMVFGAGACGARVMTTSSSPGISLMSEGISYLSGAEVPAVIVNMMRGGPGLGNIAPSQADYLQATKGGGHGDYNIIVLAPSTVQEAVDLVPKAYDLAFKYRMIVMIIADGIIGQMSEPVTLPEMQEVKKAPAWALGSGGEQKIVRSLFLSPEDMLEKHNHKLQEKYASIKKDEVMFEDVGCDDAEAVFVCYGTPARICKTAVDVLRKKGIKIGLFRPITCWPFPYDGLSRVIDRISGSKNASIFVVEMAANQLEQDVRLANTANVNIIPMNKLGGAVFSEDEIIAGVSKYYNK
jgi:2-oxoglutarate/2-oxoacid ferredoxin oxidoreductase subunit alpha